MGSIFGDYRHQLSRQIVRMAVKCERAEAGQSSTAVYPQRGETSPGNDRPVSVLLCTAYRRGEMKIRKAKNHARSAWWSLSLSSAPSERNVLPTSAPTPEGSVGRAKEKKKKKMKGLLRFNVGCDAAPQH